MPKSPSRSLPRYLELHPLNRCYYYKNPAMARKANLGKDEDAATRIATRLNLQLDRERTRNEAVANASPSLEGQRFKPALDDFVEKYIHDYRLKSSTAAVLRQRRDRLNRHLGDHCLALIDTQVLREVIRHGSQFEQSKLRSLLKRFFQYAISNGDYPSSLANPVDNLYVDPQPPKLRNRMSLSQFQAIYRASPEWLQWLLTLAFHTALRRVDLVNLRFDDVRGDRLVSAIRKSDSDARGMEATSVDFPIHPDVRNVIQQSRLSSMRHGRSPFILHRAPERRTKRADDALKRGAMEHPTQVLPQFASKAFAKARAEAASRTKLFEGMRPREMPTLHEVRSLSSHLYALAGYDVDAVQDLMAHTDPDMTRAYQQGHARRILRVEMVLPFGVDTSGDEIREQPAAYSTPGGPGSIRSMQGNRWLLEKFSKNSLRAQPNWVVTH